MKASKIYSNVSTCIKGVQCFRWKNSLKIKNFNKTGRKSNCLSSWDGKCGLGIKVVIFHSQSTRIVLNDIRPVWVYF